jgi:hypothetical protein
MVAGAMTLALGELLEGRQRPVYQAASSDSNPCTMRRFFELTAKRLDDGLGRPSCVRKHNAYALGALQQFDHYRSAACNLQDLFCLLGVVSESRHRQTNSIPRQQLHRAELVARAADANGFVEREDTHHLELSQDREAIERDRRPDPGNHGVVFVPVDDLTVIVNRWTMRCDLHEAAERIDDLQGVPAGLSGLNKTLV